MKEMSRQGRRSKLILGDIKEGDDNWTWKKNSLNLILWGTHFGIGYEQ
jgi:hypothetical protein